MTKYSPVSAKELIKLLERNGFSVVSQRGSHIKLCKQLNSGKITLIVPNHKVIKKGTYYSIVKASGIPTK